MRLLGPKRTLLTLLSVVVLASVSGCGGGNQDPLTVVDPSDPAVPAPTPGPTLTAAEKCGLLIGKTVAAGEGVVTAAAIRPAQAASAPNQQNLGEYCDIAISATDSGLKVAARLPTDNWNQKLVAVGGGGFKGGVGNLSRGITGSASIYSDRYAVLHNNGGHESSENANAAFALDGVKLAEYAYLAEHRTARFGKDVVELFYGSKPIKSYFEGCSTGGHDATMEAQRYPQDYDGIIARAPASNFVGLYLQFNRISTALRQPGGNLSVAKRDLLQSAVLAQCDALDGIADGVISKPAACNYDVSALRCAGGTDTGDTCLSDTQINTVRTITEPYTSPDGKFTHPGYNWEGVNHANGWGQYIWPSATTGLSTQMNFSDQWVRGFITRDNAFDPKTFNAADWLPELSFLGAMWQSFNPDLTPLNARGGKLIIWTGTMDTSVTPRDTARYYDAVVQKMGQAATDNLLEAFMAPGVGHCGGGPGADSIDLVKALDTWVTSGTAPSKQNLVHRKVNSDGTTALSRPLCKYPSYPRYNGLGDVNLAASYTCSTQ
jgi:hypothetical protein